MNILSEFIWTERFQYSDINVFAFNLGQASRYYDFLLVVLGRYEEANKRIVAIHEEERKLMPTQAGITRVTPEQGRLMQESIRLTTLVHLEIESFYLFAKILIDNIVKFLPLYFGEVRNVSFESHHKFANDYKKGFEEIKLVIPEGFYESVLRLKNSICNYRDKELSHTEPQKTKDLTVWGASGEAKIASGKAYPRKDDRTVLMEYSWKGGKTAVTEELPQLMEAINVYIRQVITLIESNRNKSKLRLKET